MVRNVLCTTFAGAMLRLEESGSGARQTVLLLDPELRRWPTRLRDRKGLPVHPRLLSLASDPSRVRQDRRTLYYVSAESLSGWTALDELARDGAFPDAERALRLCAEAAEALICAHEAGLTHGHLEPGCLFIQTLAPEDPGHVKLLGAGLDLIAGPASRAARYRPPGFTATEGRRRPDRAACQEADRYALGLIAYHLLTGQAPDPTAPIALEAGLLRLQSRQPALGRVLSRAIARDAAARYPTTAALHEALLLARAEVARDHLRPNHRMLPDPESGLWLDLLCPRRTQRHRMAQA